MKKLRSLLGIMGIFLAATLIGCGGGGDSTTVVNPNPEPLPATDLYVINLNSADNTAEITFGVKAISFGLMSPAEIADAEFVRWESDITKWDLSTVTGPLYVDANGIVHAKLANMPRVDQGNFALKLKGVANLDWFNGGLWVVLLDGKPSPNATFIGGDVGQFKYSM